MANFPLPFIHLLRDDDRYKAEAYLLVREALAYAQEQLGMGACESHGPGASGPKRRPGGPEREQSEGEVERHLSGQELCEAVRRYALEQYGYMAKTVLNSWGIYTTGDLGEIVYNLIRIGFMKKSKDDRREDFNDVYDFDTALVEDFRITMPG